MSDLDYMKLALKQARKAYELGETPIGCIIVYQDKVIARGGNRRMTKKSSLQHAELLAIERACRKLGDWRLDDCKMYLTLEPCPMCAGAIIQSRIAELHIAGMNPKAGCAGSIINLFECEGFNHKVKLIKHEGAVQEESSLLLKEFFKNLRLKKSLEKNTIATS